MPQSHPDISPYGTGARCEPKLWQPNSEVVAGVTRSGEVKGGKVDFNDGEDSTVDALPVSRSDDGMYIVHLMPVCDAISPRRAPGEKDLAVIELSASRPE